jgi:uncharacterized protein YsxB (DUF464 family)
MKKTMQQTEQAKSAGNIDGLVKFQEEDHEVACTSVSFMTCQFVSKVYEISHFKDLIDSTVRLMNLTMSLTEFFLEF